MPQHAATIGIPTERAERINRSHDELAKFTELNDVSYKSILAFISAVVGKCKGRGFPTPVAVWESEECVKYTQSPGSYCMTVRFYMEC